MKMLLKFLSDCRADGRSFTMGEEADVSQGAANELIALGRAEIGSKPEPAPVCTPKPATASTVSRRGTTKPKED